MLYLAEVKKQSKGFIGGLETKLKLLACQRNDQSWSAVLGDEMISAEEVNNFADGALVVANVGVNRQIQGPAEPATGRVLSIIQSFSRLVEKSRNQEEEIEQWRQSLTYQSEELHRREEDVEARFEQVEQMEKQFTMLEQQRQELEGDREEARTIRAEFENKLQELEAAWENLELAQKHVEEQKNQLQQSKIFNQQHIGKLQTLIQSLSNASMPTEALLNKIDSAFAVVRQEQVNLENNRQQLQQQTGEIQKTEREISLRAEQLKQGFSEVKALESSWLQARIDLESKKQVLNNKQDFWQSLNSYQRTQGEIQQILSRLGISDSVGAKAVDVEALENMPLPDLQKLVDTLKQDLTKTIHFVNEQEEELTWQFQAVEELKEKLANVSQYDRLTVEAQLAEEQERNRMLDETLVGQRRQLRERQAILSEHIRVLHRRQGNLDASIDTSKLDLQALLEQLQQQETLMTREKGKLQLEIQELQSQIQQLDVELEQQKEEINLKQSQLQQEQEQLEQRKMASMEVQYQASFYHEVLPSLQDALSGIQAKLESLAQSFTQMVAQSDYQQQTLAELREIL